MGEDSLDEFGRFDARDDARRTATHATVFDGVAHKTALEDVELITRMARRYRHDQIARVLSKLGRRTGKGNRWTQPRVATVRRKYAIAPPDVADLDPDILTLGADEEGGDRPVDDAQDLGKHCGAGREQEP